MSNRKPKPPRAEPRRGAGLVFCRRDGWTTARQLTFLAHLAQSGSVSRAAEGAGMSRESAYRLRRRDPHGLFAAIWDMVLAQPGQASSLPEGHTERLGDGLLLRLLGNQFRRKSGDFRHVGAGGAAGLQFDRTGPL